MVNILEKAYFMCSRLTISSHMISISKICKLYLEAFCHSEMRFEHLRSSAKYSTITILNFDLLNQETYRTKDGRKKTPAPADPWIDSKSQHAFKVVIETMTPCQ